MGSATGSLRTLTPTGAVTATGTDAVLWNLASQPVAAGALLIVLSVVGFNVVVWEDCPPPAGD